MQRENHSLQSSKIVDLVNKDNPAKTTEKETLDFFLIHLRTSLEENPAE